MCECGGRTSGWIGLIPEVHGCDKTAVHSEYVEKFADRARTSALTLPSYTRAILTGLDNRGRTSSIVGSQFVLARGLEFSCAASLNLRQVD